MAHRNVTTEENRLVDIVLGGVKLNANGTESFELVKKVTRQEKQGVSLTFGDYNLFNHLQAEENEEEDTDEDKNENTF